MMKAFIIIEKIDSGWVMGRSQYASPNYLYRRHVDAND